MGPELSQVLKIRSEVSRHWLRSIVQASEHEVSTSIATCAALPAGSNEIGSLLMIPRNPMTAIAKNATENA